MVDKSLSSKEWPRLGVLSLVRSVMLEGDGWRQVCLGVDGGCRGKSSGEGATLSVS